MYREKTHPFLNFFFMFFFIFFLGFQTLGAENSPTTCTFFTLDTISDGTLIEIRGFLYQADDSRTILAAEPNLKSCCVGSASKRHKQLLVDGNFTTNNAFPVTLQGNLSVDFTRPFPFKLQNAVLIAEKESSYGILLLAFSLMILPLYVIKMSRSFFLKW
jgi:hypothetical protein